LHVAGYFGRAVILPSDPGYVVLVFSFLIGVVCGLRSMTAPAVVAWAAHLGWLDLHASRLSFMGSTVAVAAFTLAALLELVADKLPSTPSRTTVMGLLPRIVLGALCGATLAAARGNSSAAGALLGGIGGIVGAFGGFQLRMRLVRSLRVRDFVIALAEDAVAIGAGFLIVTRL
jgi:uncharacterized membrane protein